MKNKVKLLGCKCFHETILRSINADNRLCNKCAIIWKLFPRPFGERVRERGYLAAFTLAEVLITLGIIGIIAALTLPTLMANNRRKVVETRLQKFYTVMNQAIKLGEAENGEFANWMPDNSYSDFGAWYEANLSKYIQSQDKKKYYNTIYYDVGFSDGSGFRAYMPSGLDESYDLRAWVFFFPKFESCKKGALEQFDGVNSFLFGICKNGKLSSSGVCGTNEMNRSTMLNGCASANVGSRHACTMLIQYDGWKISKDYPHRI